MNNKLFALVPALLSLTALILSSITPAVAGSRAETLDITGLQSTFPPAFDGRVVPTQWDARCMPIRYTYFDDGINEPPGAAAALTAAMDSWNSIPTSFIEFQLVDTVAAPGKPFGGLDFVNEINFDAPGGFLAAARNSAVIVDTTFQPGDDIDGDGDTDVFDPTLEGIETCADVDGDGDIEFPAGFYEAGTILDSDLFFNSFANNPNRRWTVGPGGSGDIDIEAVAVHEFGHHNGLGHSMINQRSTNGDQPGVPRTGDGSTMFPFIDFGDPDEELGQRELAEDDIAWSSFIYPEGSDASGPAALQGDDIAFDDVYGVITGEVTSGSQSGFPVAGASVQARDKSTGQIVAEGISGTTMAGVTVSGGLPTNSGFTGLVILPQTSSIVDGSYTIPVPKGNYDLFIEAPDGRPSGAGDISISAFLGDTFGLLDFEEEFYGGNQEDAFEKLPAVAKPVNVLAGENESGIDFVTNVTTKLSVSDGRRNRIGFTGSLGGRLYAARFANPGVEAFLAGDAVLHTGLFETVTVDDSVVPVFARAILAGGSVDPHTGNLLITETLREKAPFVGQDNDSATFYFSDPKDLTEDIRDDLDDGDYEDLFLILEQPFGPFPGARQFPPFIGLDSNPPYGNSYFSDDGGVTWTRVTTRNFVFDLVATP